MERIIVSLVTYCALGSRGFSLDPSSVAATEAGLQGEQAIISAGIAGKLERDHITRAEGQMLALAAPPPALNIVLSDFSGFASQNPFFSQTWENNGTRQFVQVSGFISIQSVGSGNPKDDGNFLVVPGSRDFSLLKSVEITGREDAGNQTSTFSFYLEDGSGQIAAIPFTISSFGSSFSTLSRLLPTSGIDLRDISFWGITTSSSAVSDFRVRFDNIVLTVPEPGTGLLMLFGAGLFGFTGRQRSESLRSHS